MSPDIGHCSRRRPLKDPKNFDPNLEIDLACDASSYGIGAVLSHKMSDGSEKPMGFISHTLTDAEKKYPKSRKRG